MAQPPNTGASTRRATPVGSVALRVVLLAALVVGCSSPEEPVPDEGAAVAPQAPIVVPEPLPDTRSVSLAAVAGTSLEYPVAVEGGDLALDGTVQGPDGPVGGARVLLERFVGERSGRLEVSTGPDGRWSAADVHGGRYRIRAWRSPDLAMASSDLRFLAAEETVDLALAVDRYDGADVTGGIDDETPEIDGTAVVTALATRRQVDDAGIITTAPASGEDALITTVGPWAVDGSEPAVLDGAGQVSWTLTCEEEGSVSARVEALGTETTVSATCVEPPGWKPPGEDPEEPPDPDFPIGDEFTPPFEGPIPAGEYTVTDDPGTCVLIYEAWTDDGWDPSRRTVTGVGVIEIPEIARNLEALGDSPPCTYERTS